MRRLNARIELSEYAEEFIKPVINKIASNAGGSYKDMVDSMPDIEMIIEDLLIEVIDEDDDLSVNNAVKEFFSEFSAEAKMLTNVYKSVILIRGEHRRIKKFNKTLKSIVGTDAVDLKDLLSWITRVG